MEQYIGTKIVMAEPYMAYTKTEDGQTVRKPSGDGYKVKYPDGYESFCPKEAFEEAYRRTNGMPFGLAIEAAKKGKRISRTGWNGKGMFVVYQKGYPQGIPCNEQTAKAWGMEQGELFRCEPYLQIKMVNGSHAMWVPSINDVLAEDWLIIE